MATTIPGSTKAVGNAGHTTDHNLITAALSTQLGAGVVNVRHYDVVSSGTTDQTTEIAAADAAAVSSGRPLYFPAGSYKFNTTLEARTILGDGRSTTNLKYFGTGSAIASPTPGTRTYSRLLTDFTLEQVDGIDGIGIDFNAVSMSHVRNVSVVNFNQGVVLRSTVTDAYSLYNVFIDVLASGCVEGFRLNDVSNDNRFYACRANACTNYGWRIQSGNHNLIDGACIEQTGDASGDWGIYINYTGNATDTRNNIIRSCRLENNWRNLYVLANVADTEFVQNYVHAANDPAASGATEWITDSGTGTRDQWNRYY